MTAPVSGTQSLIHTILTIRQLQQQDAAQQLMREQFGLTQAATGEQMLGHLGTLASSLPDPKVLLPHVSSIAQRTGLDPAMLTTMFSSAVPTEATTKAGVVARGTAAAGPAIEKPAAYANIVGQQPGQLAGDELHNLMFQGASRYLSKLNPQAADRFSQGVATRAGLGQSLGEAANDELFDSLSDEDKQLAVKIGKGLAPSADQVMQGRLGAGHLALQENIAAANSAMQLSVAMAEANSKLKGPQLDAAISVLKAIQNQQQFLATNSSTFTPEGILQQNAALNALYLQLQKIDPDLGKIFGPVNLSETHTATSAPKAFFQKMKQK